ncbi:MAG: hypothetical protein RLZZ292_2630 [Bacteroidota bacterium]
MKIQKFKNSKNNIETSNSKETPNKPETRNSKPETRNSKLETRNPKLETPNPKLETQNSETPNLRYTCQLLLPGFNDDAQARLTAAKVLIVGAGGLGCPSAQYLAAAGIGTLGIADFDTVSIGNLHRQILYTPDEIGQPKAKIAAEKLQRQNPNIKIGAILEKITFKNALALIEKYDLVVDGTDNFDTRYLLNDACVLLGKPLVYGAIYQYEGQVAVWNVRNEDGTFSPNYRDIFPNVDAAQVPNCAEGGVIPTVAGIIGCMQANEVLKYFSQTGELLASKILIFDAQSMLSRIIKTETISHTTITALTQVAEIQTITKKEFLENIKKYSLIDVRKTEEREAFNIGGEHLPIANLAEHLEKLSALPYPILFYCASGKRSAEAAKLLLQYAPEAVVFSLDGGMKAWRESF